MNHDAKYTGGIFRRRPSTASQSSRLGIQPHASGSVSCPVSPRHAKYLPVVPSMSSAHFHEVLNSSTSNYHDGTRLHRSPSANTYNHRQQSSSSMYNYTGECIVSLCRLNVVDFLLAVDFVSSGVFQSKTT
jgi:hypothetical protein